MVSILVDRSKFRSRALSGKNCAGNFSRKFLSVGASGIDLGGSILNSFKGSRSQDCAHNGSIHKFNRSIDTLLKNDLDKKLTIRHKKYSNKLFKNWKFDSPKLKYNRMTYLSFNQGVRIDSYWSRMLPRAYL